LNFEVFCDEIAANIYNYLPDYDIEAVNIEKVIKNNGVECTGIIVILKEENIAPNIYLDYYYTLYKQGRTLDDVLTMIGEEYIRARNTMVNTDFNIEVDAIKDNAIVKLVNYERNKEKLEKCPHIRFLDLAISFRYIVKLDELGMASAMISNSDLARWNMNQDELYNIAMENTKRLFPASIKCMDDLVPEIEDICSKMEERKKLNILTNESGINGATCMVYENVIGEYAKKIGKSLFILPSSIHEVILIECEDVEKEGLMKLVKEVNKFIVSEVDFLSDNVYFYDLETDKITI